MAISDELVRLGDWMMRRSNHVYFFLLAYLAALASLLSFAYTNTGGGTPSTLEFALISIAVVAGFALALDAGKN
jgi:hypothetical protein